MLRNAGKVEAALVVNFIDDDVFVIMCFTRIQNVKSVIRLQIQTSKYVNITQIFDLFENVYLVLLRFSYDDSFKHNREFAIQATVLVFRKWSTLWLVEILQRSQRQLVKV